MTSSELREQILHSRLLEARFPSRMAFVDFVGRIADELGDAYPEGEVQSTEIRFRDLERDVELLLAPTRVWIRAGKEAAEAVVAEFDNAVSILGKHVGIEQLEFVGARQMILHRIGSVEDATATFRANLFDYRRRPLQAFGKDPTEARAVAAFRFPDGACRVEITSVALSGESKLAGALLIDVDRTRNEGTDPWGLREEAENLLTDGLRRALDFIGQLKRARAPTDG